MTRTIIILLTVINIATISSAQVKKVLLEDFTATWCGFCPEGSVISDTLEYQYGLNYTFIQNHTSDNLTVVDGTTLSDDLSVFFYPNGSIDRYLFDGNSNVWMNKSNWVQKTEERLATPAIASLSFQNLNYNNSTREMNVDVNVVFYQMPLDKELVFNMAIVEDSIPATGENAQTNYSSVVQNGSSPLNDWWHNHTLRDWLNNGPWGEGGDIPQNPEIGTVYSKSFNYTLPDEWVANQIYLIGTVSYKDAFNESEILNSEEIKLVFETTTGLNNNQLSEDKIQVFPNPVEDLVFIQFELATNQYLKFELFDVDGKKIKNLSKNYYNVGVHSVRENLSMLKKGIYFIKVLSNNQTSIQTMKIVKI